MRIAYSLAHEPVRPFTYIVVTYRRVFVAYDTSGTGQFNSNTAGFIVSGGLTFRALFLRIEPEVRYTRWSSGLTYNVNNAVIESAVNQADFLAGITF